MSVWVDDTSQILYNVHKPEACEGRPCPVHNPSEEASKIGRRHYRFDRGIMERICEHGIGHPDPDDLHIRNGDDPGIHGCDGCCLV